MLSASDFQVRSFASGPELLAGLGELTPGAILLDIRMPEMDGLELMAELAERHVQWPVVVMTGHGEVSVAVRAMKLGAVDFLEKPFGEDVLLAALQEAFTKLRQTGEKVERQRVAKQRAATLTPREREMLQGLVAGLSNKMIARKLDISLRTVEMHRANMMERLRVVSLAEALTLAVDAGIEPLKKDAA